MTPQLPPYSPLYARYIKRPLEFTAALLMLILLTPLLLFICALLHLLPGGRVIFRQRRTGYRCREFDIIKFRTMTDERDERGELLPDSERTPRLGHLLRSTSLDELPELLSVLKGDMALIGPRPWIPEKLEIFPERTRQRRLAIRPGISGLAQVLGRNELNYRQRVCYDLIYQRHLSFRTDCWILYRTVCKVFKRDGIVEKPGMLAASRRGATAEEGQNSPQEI